MLRHHRLGLLTCGLVVCAILLAEKKSRSWRIPSYHVSIPVEFDVDDAEGVWKRGEVIHYSSRKQYLRFHKRGWEIAKNEWVHGHMGNRLVQAASPANEAMKDGRQQFHREKQPLITLPNLSN